MSLLFLCSNDGRRIRIRRSYMYTTRERSRRNGHEKLLSFPSPLPISSFPSWTTSSCRRFL